jgi:hypothetical protein
VQWADGRCGLADRIMTDLADLEAAAENLPRCGIRATCRWFAQHRTSACHACPMVLRKPA